MRERTSVGGYRLIKRIGAGGMSTVFEAEDGAGGRVALKLFNPGVLAQDNGRERLRREVAMLQKVRGPYVAEVLDAETDEQEAFVVTELVDGPTLEQDVADSGVYSGDDLANLAESLGKAVESIHRAGVLHRDLKPSNVMIGRYGPVLIDFGIAQFDDDARLTSPGSLAHTPGYCDPRVIHGSDPDESADWWALAAVIAFAATGRPPFGHGATPAIMHRVLAGTLDVKGLPAPIAAAFSRAMDTDLNRRIGYDELVDVLRTGRFADASAGGGGSSSDGGESRGGLPAAAAAAGSVAAGAALGAAGAAHAAGSSRAADGSRTAGAANAAGAAGAAGSSRGTGSHRLPGGETASTVPVGAAAEAWPAAGDGTAAQGVAPATTRGRHGEASGATEVLGSGHNAGGRTEILSGAGGSSVRTQAPPGAGGGHAGALSGDGRTEILSGGSGGRTEILSSGAGGAGRTEILSGGGTVNDAGRTQVLSAGHAEAPSGVGGTEAPSGGGRTEVLSGAGGGHAGALPGDGRTEILSGGSGGRTEILSGGAGGAGRTEILAGGGAMDGAGRTQVLPGGGNGGRTEILPAGGAPSGAGRMEAPSGAGRTEILPGGAGAMALAGATQALPPAQAPPQQPATEVLGSPPPQPQPPAQPQPQPQQELYPPAWGEQFGGPMPQDRTQVPSWMRPAPPARLVVLLGALIFGALAVGRPVGTLVTYGFVAVILSIVGGSYAELNNRRLEKGGKYRRERLGVVLRLPFVAASSLFLQAINIALAAALGAAAIWGMTLWMPEEPRYATLAGGVVTLLVSWMSTMNARARMGIRVIMVTIAPSTGYRAFWYLILCACAAFSILSALETISPDWSPFSDVPFFARARV